MFSKDKSVCHFHAQIDAEVIVMHAVTVVVTASWEIIETNHISSAKGRGEINSTQKIKIKVVPVSNFSLIEESGNDQEIDVLQLSEPRELFFYLRTAHHGFGEISLVAKQGEIIVAFFTLKAEVVKIRNSGIEMILATQIAFEPKPLSKPLHMLWITELKGKNASKFKYQLYSEQFKIDQRSFSEFISGDRKDYIKRLYNQIEGKRLTTSLEKQNFAKELRAFGANLFDELIPKELQTTLWENRHQFKSIQLISTEPFIPWELIHLKDPAQKGMPEEEIFLGQMGLVRWISDVGENGWPSETIKIRRGQARYVIPKYPHPAYRLPEAENEINFLVDNFGATPVKPEFGDVLDIISGPGKFDLLHFACHGGADSDSIMEAKLLMEGHMERNKYIMDPFTLNLVSAHGALKAEDNMPLIVLNACQCGRMGFKLIGVGGFADAFLSKGAGAFIGALWSIGDSPARVFTETLYKELLNGEDLSTAAISARKAAKDSGDATWLAYTVYGHPHMTIRQ